jgi:hypothetical protein
VNDTDTTPENAKTSNVSSTASVSSGKATVDTKATKVSGTTPVSSGKTPEPAKTSKDTSTSFTPTKNTTPAKSPKSGKTGLLIGILIAAVVVIILGIVLYNRFFVPKEIHVSENNLALEVGDVAKLTYTVLPESADNLEVAWASSDPNVAVVDEFGTVTAVSGGQCIIAVATGNNKTDTCVVVVNDLKQVQKESLATVVKYVDSQETAVTTPQPAVVSQEAKAGSDENADSQKTDADAEGTPADSQDASAEGEYKLLGVKDIDDAHSFLVGAEGEDLILVYRTVEELGDLGVDALYTTYVRLKPEDTETADVIQENNLTLYGYPISTTATGVINLSTYQYGDKVALNDINSTVKELDATDTLQEQADKGTALCIHEFASFLNDLAFEFGVAEFGLEDYQEPDDTTIVVVEEAKDDEAAEVEEAATSVEDAVAEEAAASVEEAVAEDAVAEEAAASVEEAVVEDAVAEEAAASVEEAVAEDAATEEAAASVEEAVVEEAVAEEAAASVEEAVAEDAATEEAATSEEAAASEEAAVAEETESVASVAESTESTKSAAESAPAETSSTFSEFPKAGPTSSAVSVATESLAKAG